jgi:peptide deformylase
MNIHIVRNLVILSITFILFVGCTNNGLTPIEKERVIRKGATEIMPVMTIFSHSDSLLLRQQTRKIERYNINSHLIQLLKSRMLATVNDSLNSGVGIAAPQVGIGIKMILVKRFDKIGQPFEAYYNPKITELSDSINSGSEGCLSLPGYKGTVERSQRINISYFDSTGEKKKEEISGFTAVIFQHEIDHLNGILYYDHILGGFNSLNPSSN